MANTLRFKRGIASGIPTALAGEPLFTTDTFDLYIGNGTTNTRFQKYIASGATTQILRGDGSLYTFPLAISSPSNGQVLKYNGTSWVNDSDAGITGSLTTNYLPKATGATTLGNSNLINDASGNLGFGVTLSTWSGYGLPIVEIPSGGTIVGAGSSTTIGTNWYYNGAFIYKASSGASYYIQNAGRHIWYYAPSGTAGNSITFTEAGRFHGTGNFGIGTGASDTGQRLQVIGTGYFSDSVGIGSTSLTSRSLVIGRTISGATSGYGILQASTYGSGVTADAINNYSQILTSAATYTLTNAYHYYNADITIGSGSSVTNQYGFFAANIVAATNNFGFYGNIASGTGRWNFYANGTAANFLSGDTLIGSATASGNAEKLQVTGNALITPATQYTAITATGGLFIKSTLTSANGVIGLTGNGFILQGRDGASTAFPMLLQPYGSNLLIGSTTDSGEKLQVTGTMKVTGASSFGSSIIATGLISSATEYRLNNNTFTRVAKIDAQGGFAGGYNLDIVSGPTVTHAETGAISGIRYAGSGNLFFFTNTSQSAGTTATTRMTLDASGNLGLGVTPSAWSGKSMQIVNSSLTDVASSLQLTYNAYFDGSNWRYLTSAAAANYYQGSGAHIWRTAASGTAGAAITFTQAMTLTAAGRLLLNQTSDTGEQLQVTGTAKITGATVINDNLTISKTQNSTTSIIVSNPDTTTATYSTQAQFRVDVAGNQIGALKATARNLGGLSRSALYLTTIGSYDLAFGVNSSGTPSMVLDINQNFGIGLTTPTERLHVSGNAIVTGNLTVDTNTLFVDATNNRVGILTTTPSYGLHVQGTGYFSDNVRFPNLKGIVFVQSGGSLLGSISMDSSNQVTIDNNGFFGLSVGTSYNLLGGNTGIGTSSFGTSATRTFAMLNGTAPSSSPVDSFQLYSNDVTAGNAAPHIRTENGAVVKIYQQTSAVGTASWVGGAGSTVTDLDTFDGYTIGQIVKALRNAGFLQ